MDWNLVLNYLLKILGSALATLVITFASILFAKLNLKIKESRIILFIKQAVKAAEQLYPNEGKKMGPQKYKYVVEQTLLKFPNLDNVYLKALIEGAVYGLTIGLEDQGKLKITKAERKALKKEKKNKKENKIIEEDKKETTQTTLSSF